MFRAGRITAALLLVAVGAMLFIDQYNGTDYLNLLVHWWPVIIILVGLEYLLASLLHHRSEKGIRLDYGGIIFAVLIALLVISLTQPASMTSRIWNSLIQGDVFSLADEGGMKFDKGMTVIPLNDDTEGLLLENPNGAVVIQAGDVDHIEIETTMYIPKLKQDKAQEVVDLSSIEFSEGRTLHIAAKGEKYKLLWIHHKPRMNLVVTVPRQREINMELKLANGKIQADSIPVKDVLKATTSNGSIQISNVAANVSGATTNGRIDVQSVQGSVSMKTTNGSVTIRHVDGGLDIKTTNGGLTMQNVGGHIRAKTTNGKIDLQEAAKDVHLETTNGGISVSSHTVGGAWNLDTTIGSISLYLPEEGNFTVSGESGVGKNSSEFPFSLSQRKIEGTVGNGEHRIELDTNGRIDLHKIN